jgi:hypothetical protein
MNGEVVALSQNDVEGILTLERESFPSPLRAERETILQRMKLGHTMLGIRDGAIIRSMISYSLARFSPDSYDSFPKTFREFSLLPEPSDANAVFIYNLEVARSLRGGRDARLLLRAALDRAKASGCTYAVGDGRISSYAGDDSCPQAKTSRTQKLRRSVDRYLAGGRFPTDDELLLDPTLALYRRITGAEFLWIIPEFIREDRASGGLRVIVYGPLSTWQTNMSYHTGSPLAHTEPILE